LRSGGAPKQIGDLFSRMYPPDPTNLETNPQGAVGYVKHRDIRPPLVAAAAARRRRLAVYLGATNTTAERADLPVAIGRVDPL